MATAKKLPSLEEAFKEISSLVDKMEHSELTLEQSLNHFERGIQLIKHCQKMLETAEQKVQMLMQTNNQATLVNYGEMQLEGKKDNENNT